MADHPKALPRISMDSLIFTLNIPEEDFFFFLQVIWESLTINCCLWASNELGNYSFYLKVNPTNQVWCD